MKTTYTLALALLLFAGTAFAEEVGLDGRLVALKSAPRFHMHSPQGSILMLLPPGHYDGLNQKSQPCAVDVLEDASVRISPSATNVGGEDAVYFRHADKIVSSVAAMQASVLQVQTQADEYMGRLDLRPVGDSIQVSALAYEPDSSGGMASLKRSGQCQLKAM